MPPGKSGNTGNTGNDADDYPPPKKGFFCKLNSLSLNVISSSIAMQFFHLWTILFFSFYLSMVLFASTRICKLSFRLLKQLLYTEGYRLYNMADLRAIVRVVTSRRNLI